MKSRYIYISKHKKLKIYTKMIKPTVLHGCETWAITQQMKSALKTWQHNILRKIYGSIKDQNGWRVHTNVELLAMYREPDIVTIKVRLEWAGHLVRMSDDSTVKKVFLWKPDGRGKVGRPKLRWLDGTENDLKFTGVKRWRKNAEDRSLWAIILKEALVKL
jgi:hypothetical protein